MKLICSAKLSKSDIEEIEKAEKDPERIIESNFIRDLDILEDKFVEDHVRAFGWMLANNKLDIRIAVVRDEKGSLLNNEMIEKKGIFHQKVGVMSDFEGNSLSFSGSANESASGLIHNIEEFKVFRSWIPSEKEYFESDIKRFDKFWNSDGKRTQVIELPRAIKEKLIEMSPNNLDEIDLKKWLKYRSTEKSSPIQLFEHQEKAIENWFQKGKKGIFEMATGTGKTFTALGCIEKLIGDEKFVCIISCPGNVLVQQWRREATSFGLTIDSIVADSSSKKKWQNELADSLVEISLGYKDSLLVFTTHNTLSSNGFIDIIMSRPNGVKLFLIGDEVHRLGARNWSKGLLEEYEFRLGLSATPKRWFDLLGSEKIYDFFGQVIFEFSLNDAITKTNLYTGLTYLTPYRYIPYFVSLNDEELQDYIEKTKAIIRRFHKAKSKNEIDDIILEFLLFKRADIIKNVEEKYEALENILEQINSNIKWTIIYCSPEQIDRVMSILFERRIISQRFTGDEGKYPMKKYGGISERDFILNKFAKGDFQVLVAMKILDEGIDVPPARTAIFMSNSTNPLQYIQRIGRVIRRYLGKTEATIYDMIVVPRTKNVPKGMKEFEIRIFENEKIRYKEISQNANNNVDALNRLYNNMF